jgi:hypothetical protein
MGHILGTRASTQSHVEGHHGGAAQPGADCEWLSRHKWHLCGGGYAARNEKGKRILMHRQTMQPPEGMIVNRIDARRANDCQGDFRVCTPRLSQ